MIHELNVLGTKLEPCCYQPVTGYFRDGFCRTMSEDTGTHVICAVVTLDFLEYTKQQGNDLSTPIPHWNFPGLQPGDKWCLCISRWLQANKAGKAPPVVLESSQKRALEYTDLEILLEHRYENKNS
ncbi:hypothetical protein SAMN04487910_1729 [Aquimarina amphilecti]|uniref:DUF2237 domain-containing protein n=1 Tax=Aquimarina amphilecti TaxID=1038014 RepID=A0A1H7MIE2_AQUAM|nr:DUF2237 domain-containing protein [Aquimarina amphilecti]SEL10377.1 hypothetical protein SAMN04487910_1729 [Aquimarina amphilecti]